MALKPCPECGRQISELAPSCPQCGAPNTRAAAAGAAPPPAPAASGARAPTKATFIVLAAVGVAAILGWNLATRGVLVPLPRYRLVSSSADDLCSTLGDYCQRARCAIRNVGNVSGTATVTATMAMQDRMGPSKSVEVAIAPGEERDATIDFKEATIGSPFDRVVCVVH